MENRHCIESAVLKISYANEELALSQNGELEVFAKTELFAIVDEVFNDISDSDAILYFDKLEVDLGEISLAYFYQDFGARLKEKIRECLENEISQNSHNPGSNYEKIPVKRSELDVVCQFLSTGRLPWNANIDKPSDIEDALVRVIANDSDSLASFIRGAENRNDIIVRLSTQFSSEILCGLLAPFVDVRPAELEDYVSHILALGESNFGLARHKVERRVWSELLLFAYLSRSGCRTVREVLTQVIQVVSLHVPHHLPVFLERLLQLTQSNSRSSKLHGLIAGISEHEEFESDLSFGEKSPHSLDPEAWFDSGQKTSEDYQNDPDEQERRSESLIVKARLVHAVNSGSITKLKPVWQHLHKKHSEVLKEVLITLGQKQQVRRNIAHYFMETMIKDIVELLEPSNYRFVEQFVDEPKLYLQADEELQVQESDTRKSLWEFTLTYLLVERGSRFNKKSYVASMMSKLAAHFNVKVSELYQSLMTMLAVVSENDPMAAELLTLLAELNGEDIWQQDTASLQNMDSATPPDYADSVVDDTSLESNDDRAARQLPPEHAIEALNLAFSGDSLAELKTVWKLLLSQHGQWLRDALYEAGKQETARQNMAKHFPNLMFKEVIFLVEPVHGAFVSEIVHRSTTRPTEKGKRLEAPQKTKRVVREFTLTYLLVDRGSRFNKRSYITGLLKKMAANENTSVQMVYQAIRQSAQSVAFMKPMQKEILQLLSEVAQELGLNKKSNGAIEEPKPVLASVQESPATELQDALTGITTVSKETDESREFAQLELIRAYLLYEKLVAAITGASSPGGKVSYHVVRLLHELIENYPWILHRINQEVDAGQLSFTGVIPQLPKPLQRKILLTFFASFATRYPFTQKQFSNQLEKLERMGSLDSRLYSSLFQRLLSKQLTALEELFDLEEFDAAQSGLINRETAAVVASSHHSGIEESDGHTPLSLNKGTSDLIRSHLMGQLNLAEQDKMTIVSTIELMLSSHPNSLAQLLKETLIDRAASDRLAAVLPESLLVKLMLLLRPDDRFKVILYADLMTMAAVETDKSARVQVGGFHLAKWQFILNYMVIEGRRFNEVSFVRLFSDYLFKRHSSKTHGDFVSSLSASIGISSSPATHVAGVRIAMILGSASITNQQPTGQLGDRANEQTDKSSASKQVLIPNPEELPDQESSSSLDYFNEDEDSGVDEDIYIENAGLVLLAPYLPRYFDMLGLLEKNKFKDREAAERAVHLLQYLQNESTDSFEYQLVLNKLLCGVEAGTPIVRSIDITEQEVEASASLLQGIIANWPVLKNTSIDGLRETFLQREAHLQLKNDAWHLLVQSKAFDMLMDSIPWSFSTIKLAWMKRPIHVEWR